jgi:GT2 family glycosyltransferase
VELDADWLDTLLPSVTGDAWFATGKILQFGSNEILDGTFDLVCRGGCSWRAGSGRRVSDVYEKPRRIAIAPMTAALFRRQLFDEVGWLDERFESYLEDTDFGLRCAAAGRTGCYIPGAVAWHRGSASLGRWNQETVRLISRNQVFLAAKYTPRLHWPVILAQGLWGLVAARHGQPGAWISGKREGWRRRGEFARQPVPGNVLVELERDLYRLQSADGMDAYWRLYFLLTGMV